jgi:hypothetical protein
MKKRERERSFLRAAMEILAAHHPESLKAKQHSMMAVAGIISFDTIPSSHTPHPL